MGYAREALRAAPDAGYGNRRSVGAFEEPVDSFFKILEQLGLGINQISLAVKHCGVV